MNEIRRIKSEIYVVKEIISSLVNKIKVVNIIPYIRSIVHTQI